MTHQSEEEFQLLQRVAIPETGLRAHSTILGGSKEKRKRSPPKNDSPIICKGGGSESPPQAKVFGGPRYTGSERPFQISLAIILRQKSM